MTIEEFFSIVFKHPGIPPEMKTIFFNKFCEGSSKLSFYNFIVAITLLSKKDALNQSN